MRHHLPEILMCLAMLAPAARAGDSKPRDRKEQRAEKRREAIERAKERVRDRQRRTPEYQDCLDDHVGPMDEDEAQDHCDDELGVE